MDADPIGIATAMPFHLIDVLGQPLWAWAMFLGIVVTLLVLDLGVLHRKSREITVRESFLTCAGYMAIACLFGAWVWWSIGPTSGLEFFTGYFVEWSLALDNIFVISIIFSYFAVPREHQHRVLFWGILGVIVMRGVMIGLGAALIAEFSWILYVFGAFLLFTGVKMLIVADQKPKLEDNPVLRFLRRRIRVTERLHGESFFVTQTDPASGRSLRYATPLFLCLVLVEIADLVFAVDSVPAIFAISQNTFIVYTSNIFAILGLRALYFALAAMVHRFVYLKYALAAVLIFIGAKIFWSHLVGKLDPLVSLIVTLGLLAAGILASLLRGGASEAQAPSSRPSSRPAG